MTFDQVECARAWAKVLAYRRCGEEAKAREWFERLCVLLGYDVVIDGPTGYSAARGFTPKAVRP